jgi:DNA-binding protein HU-beta
MNCNIDQAHAIIYIFLDGILLGLEEQDEISLVGFGRFYKRKMQSRQGRNPKTGETLNIPAHVQLKFFVGKKLKEACNPKPKKPIKKAKKTTL